ncbi:MAG TPA: alkaline phosphatase family protein [Chitinophagaceae bacterium]|nr:alkaline phosphatase family protein [Chitinophagaceae bacterium]
MKKITVAVTFIFYLSGCLSQGSQKTYLDKYYTGKRIIVIMFDGFGMSYFNNSSHPNIDRMIKEGMLTKVKALMPTVTNCNNVSICAGTFPEENGITGNSFLDTGGHEEYMESGSLVTAPNLFERLNQYHRNSALISSKKKTLGLLSKGTAIGLSPEVPDSEWVRLLGQPPSIYSAEINYWSMEAALYILKNRKEISCLYIHTTDYPMHTWSPGDTNSQKHIARIDQYIGEISRAAPDAMILITADHDVNHKSRCVDIEKSLDLKGAKIRIAISAERDKYLAHHRGFGGTSFVYLNNKADTVSIKNALLQIKGVKTVLTNNEAAKLYHLKTDRIGDLVVLADSITVFGTIDTPEEELPDTYRTHGSEYEIDVPLMIFNASKRPDPAYFSYNKDLVRWLFEQVE